MLLKLTSTKEEISGVKSFIWEKPAGLTFYPGQYLDYELEVTDPEDNSRSFTISASPTEDFLMLTTRAGQSTFKQELFTLQPGDTIESSHPAGTFILDETSTAVMIAGGVGITPFRSMIKYAFDNKLATPITLIYLNSDDNFPFKKELDNWQKHLPKLNIIYYNTTKNGHLTTLDTKYIIPDTIYYLAGPPKMVDNFDQILKSLGVEEINIRYDHFDGY